jgi:hypothetical protein
MKTYFSIIIALVLFSITQVSAYGSSASKSSTGRLRNTISTNAGTSKGTFNKDPYMAVSALPLIASNMDEPKRERALSKKKKGVFKGVATQFQDFWNIKDKLSSMLLLIFAIVSKSVKNGMLKKMVIKEHVGLGKQDFSQPIHSRFKNNTLNSTFEFIFDYIL